MRKFALTFALIVSPCLAYGETVCRNGQCQVVRKTVTATARVATGTAQGVANLMARTGRLAHMGGNPHALEGIGMGSTPDQALRRCCYYGRMRIADQGVAQGANGRWYACIRGR
jgi:hypothetical protein